MSADALLARLDGVRETGRGQWKARCPAHHDRAPSLSIRELDDGRVLVKDFGGCPVADVLASIGLDFHALFPPRAVDHHVRREREPFPARDVLFALADEVLVVAVAAASLSEGGTLTADDVMRLHQAAVRINDAAALFKVHPAAGHLDALSLDELDELCHA